MDNTSLNVLRLVATILLGECTLGGCAGVPPLDLPNDHLTLSQIADQIECEVWRASRDNPELRNPQHPWTVAASLTLTVDDGAGLTPTVAYSKPLSIVGTSFKFGGSATLSTARERIFQETLDFNVLKARNTCASGFSSSYDLTGDLGIYDTARLALRSSQKDDGSISLTAASTGDGAFGATIKFTVVKNLSAVGPTWSLVHFTGPGGLFGVNRTDTHQIVFSFVQGTGSQAQQKAHNHIQNLLLRGIEQQLQIGPIQ
jgi:hypothetical protein